MLALPRHKYVVVVDRISYEWKCLVSWQIRQVLKISEICLNIAERLIKEREDEIR
jgi:hypothetical protein